MARPVRAPIDGSAAPPPEVGPSLFSLAATAETLPYAAPQTAPRAETAAHPPGDASAFTVRGALAEGSRRFAEQWVSALGIGAAALGTWLVGQALIVLGAAPLLALARVAGNPPLDGLANLLGLATAVGATLASLALAAWLWAGLRRFALRAARGESARVGDLYQRGPLAAMLGVLLLLGAPWLAVRPMASGAGAPLAILAIAALDILLASLLGQSASRLVDGKAGFVEALRWSVRACRKRWRPMAGLYALLCLAYLLTTLLSAGLALVVVAPWAEMVVSAAYLRLVQHESDAPTA